MFRRLETLLHPFWNVTACLDFPFVDFWDMTELFELLANPERPLAIAAREADEDIGHSHCPRAGPSVAGDHGW
jgi:hypothetical protein